MQITWRECEESGLNYTPVPGGRIYEIDWQYDFGHDAPSKGGVNHVFVPTGERIGADK